jgi:hypothetical protein
MGMVMSRVENFRQYAADCVRQAEGQQSPEDKNILLNVALAWVRLAQQSQAHPPDKSGPPAAKPVAAGGAPAPGAVNRN